MPTYDYTCRDCLATFELFATGSLKEEQKKCPECGSTDVEQCFTGFLQGSTSSSGSCGSGAPSCGFS